MCIKSTFKAAITVLAFLMIQVAYGQTTVSGKVTDAQTKEPLPGVNILVEGTVTGTSSKGDGSFTLKVKASPPIVLIFSSVGYTPQTITISEADTPSLEVNMEEQTVLGQEVVVSASRMEESILKSPVTIEKIDILAIQQAPVAEYFEALATTKGVQVMSSSLNFPQVNTRGFATIANERFVQWIDGIDGAAPILNFPTGNIVGIGELDAESMELIPGAASALYGPNAFNGILIMKSKSPFDYQGLSAQFKGGMTTSKAQGQAYPLYNFGLRYAKAFNNKFAFKINFSIFDAEDWHGNDYKTDRLNPESTTDLSGNTDFDGLNLYGDEALIAIPGFGNLKRTGFREEDIIDDYSARSIKADGALHYRITDKIEALYNYRFGSGNAIFQGDAKYALRNFTQVFQKLEVKGDNFFVRGYLTSTDAGDSYNLLALGSYMNERYNPTKRTDGTTPWVYDYLNAFNGYAPGYATGDHNAARAYADRNRPTTQADIKALADEVRNDYFQRNPPGAKFIDNSRIWHGEFNYNFKNQIKFAEIMIGGNVRRYDLFTDGTILNEDPGASSVSTAINHRVTIDEFGAYAQISKTLADVFKLTGSLRYDKNQNFDGLVTPRISAVYTVSENHNIRASYQTGFRNPQTQAQYIYFPASDAILLGSTQANAERYGVHNGGSYTRDSYRLYQKSGGVLTDAGPVGGNQALLVETNVPYVSPEHLKAIEIGYKGVFAGDLMIDLNGYYNIYNDFMGTDYVASKVSSVHQGTTLPAGTIFSLYSNSPEQITSYGIGLGITYNLPKDFTLSANYNHADFSFDQVGDRVFHSGFNTPNNKFNVGIGNRKLAKNFGFNVNFRWQEEFEWFSSFGAWNVPSFGVFDAAISYRVASIKSILKLGGTNLGGGDYRTNLGGPFVGQQYFLSITFDELFK